MSYQNIVIVMVLKKICNLQNMTPFCVNFESRSTDQNVKLCMSFTECVIMMMSKLPTVCSTCIYFGVLSAGSSQTEPDGPGQSGSHLQ